MQGGIGGAQAGWEEYGGGVWGVRGSCLGAGRPMDWGIPHGRAYRDKGAYGAWAFLNTGSIAFGRLTAVRIEAREGGRDLGCGGGTLHWARAEAYQTMADSFWVDGGTARLLWGSSPRSRPERPAAVFSDRQSEKRPPVALADARLLWRVGRNWAARSPSPKNATKRKNQARPPVRKTAAGREIGRAVILAKWPKFGVADALAKKRNETKKQLGHRSEKGPPLGRRLPVGQTTAGRAVTLVRRAKFGIAVAVAGKRNETRRQGTGRENDRRSRGYYGDAVEIWHRGRPRQKTQRNEKNKVRSSARKTTAGREFVRAVTMAKRSKFGIAVALAKERNETNKQSSATGRKNDRRSRPRSHGYSGETVETGHRGLPRRRAR